MKKTIFKIRLYNDGIDSLQEVIAEEYDELTYYVSPRTNKDFNFKYSLYDKNTGLMICSATNKQELIDKYNKVTERYTQVRESAHYKKYIEKYEQLKRGGNENV